MAGAEDVLDLVVAFVAAALQVCHQVRRALRVVEELVQEVTILPQAASLGIRGSHGRGLCDTSFVIVHVITIGRARHRRRRSRPWGGVSRLLLSAAGRLSWRRLPRRRN